MPPLPPKRILVVDDEPFVCESIRMLLAHDGHEVETAQGGEEALAKYDPARFDLIFTDFSMPGMKGDQLATAIKEKKPARPVVMLTAGYGPCLQVRRRMPWRSWKRSISAPPGTR